jgi:hypothetical protein
MQPVKNCIIVAHAKRFDGVEEEIFAIVENDDLKFLRYVPYRGAVEEHEGMPARFAKSEATRMTVEEARRILVRELMRRGDRPESSFWARDLRIVEGRE